VRIKAFEVGSTKPQAPPTQPVRQRKSLALSRIVTKEKGTLKIVMMRIPGKGHQRKISIKPADAAIIVFRIQPKINLFFDKKPEL
jgi:hypothetical protein